MDGRVLPDAGPVAPPTDPDSSTQSAPTQQAAVTQVAVLPTADEQGNATNVYVVLEQAGNEYVVTYYDAAQNQYYTDTDSPDTALYYAATPDLDALMAQYGRAGDRNGLVFVDTSGQAVAPPTVQAGLPGDTLATSSSRRYTVPPDLSDPLWPYWPGYVVPPGWAPSPGGGWGADPWYVPNPGTPNDLLRPLPYRPNPYGPNFNPTPQPRPEPPRPNYPPDHRLPGDPRYPYG